VPVRTTVVTRTLVMCAAPRSFLAGVVGSSLDRPRGRGVTSGYLPRTV